MKTSLTIRHKIILLAMLLTHSWQAESVFSQSSFLPSGHEWHGFIDRIEIKSGGISPYFHSSLKPLDRRAMVRFLEYADTAVSNLTAVDQNLINQILQMNSEWATVATDYSARPLLRHFYHTPFDLLRYHDDEFFLVVNPVLNIHGGLEDGNQSWLFTNTRGAEFRGIINNRVGFYSYLTDNQSRFPSYVTDKINMQEGAIPGEGWNIPFGDGGYDFFTARGYIAFQATRNIGLQFGQDRNFIGNGTRSLLLSDYANNYLFLKIDTRIWRLHYQNIFARLVDFPLRTYGGRLFDAKFMATHTLSINLSDRFQIGFFENIVFGRTDTISRRGFDAHYLNPIIFYRAVEHHIGDPDMVALGVNWRWIAGRRVAFYGQVFVDDFLLSDVRNDLDSLWVSLGLRRERKHDDFGAFRNKFGFQQGMQWFDVLGVRNMDLRLEGNWVRPFTYSHFDASGAGLTPSGSYTHYRQALAHPLGANFREYIAKLNYRPHLNWVLDVSMFYATQGMDSVGVNLGSDIFRDYTTRIGDHGHTFLQGYKRRWQMLQAGISWQWKPGFWFDFTYIYRNENFEDPSMNDRINSIFQVGLRANALRREHWF